MSLDETRFHTLADEMLERMADSIDDALGDKIDVDYEHGIVNMKLPDGAVYVINKHGPMRQIWMSSPVSGASHFDFTDDHWIATRPPHGELVAMVVSELKAKFGVAVGI